MPSENVKVAVRVRPFNDREKNMGAKLCIAMHGQTTEITNPENNSVKEFAFDYSYWSHDGFKERPDGYFEPSTPKYADQKKVFDDLGQGVLTNAWEGYNCSLFAYGQTGSGKSYSMVGYNSNRGIVPVVCSELFKEIETKRKTQQEGDDYQVSLSMLEIYNEKVRDLLTTKVTTGGLKVRQHPNKGFYAEGLTTASVNSYANIEAKINEGTRNRTVAATNMNATSSRAHTIVAINFNQKSKASGQSMTKSSVMNLVDLAGSERASSTGAAGDRLKEGAAINQSLSTLGNVIKALADLSTGQKATQVPFRDSMLTKLLKNALGGNSKTVMIAALSPADVNYEETLSTLRFADRAKAIKTTATINESPTEKLIRELKEENQRLLDMLKGKGVPMAGPGGEDAASKEEMNRILEQNAREMEEMQRSYEERMAAMAVSSAQGQVEDADKKKRLASEPHMWNLNEDASLTNVMQKFFPNGKTLVGNGKVATEEKGAIVFRGGGIRPEHAWINNNKGKVTVTPLKDCAVKVNGKLVTSETVLHHGDRLLFGEGMHLYVFHHPADYAKNMKSGKAEPPPDYDKAMEEIAEAQGSLMKSVAGKDLSKAEQLLRDELIKKLPMVNQANSMAEELQKNVKFEIAPISAQARGLPSGPTILRVKVKNESNGLEFFWDWDKFDNRYFMMQEMYGNYMEGDPKWDRPQEKDPFWDPPDLEVEIGHAHLYLQSLAYMMDTRETLKIFNYQGLEVGELNVSVSPCDGKGNPMNDSYVEDPSELENKPYKICLEIIDAKKLSERFQKAFCRYTFYVEKEVCTDECSASGSATVGHKRVISYPKVTKQLIDYFNEEVLVFTVFGRQRAATGKPAQKASKPEPTKNDKSPAKQAIPANDSAKAEIAGLKSELQDERKNSEKLEKKINQIQMLINDARKNQSDSISVDVLDKILASSADQKRLKSAVNPSANSRKLGKEMEDKMGSQTSKACTTM